MKAELFYSSSCQLGESPIWDEDWGSCFWIDILGKSIYEYKWDSKTISHYQINHLISLVVPGRKGELITAFQGGVGRFNLANQSMSVITDMNLDWKYLRCNDGVADNDGQLWVGTMYLQHLKNAGSVYRINAKNQLKVKIKNVTISNGMCWSLDNKRLYYTDSVTREIRSYFFDKESDDLHFEKVVVRIPQDKGLPDGMAMDEEGNIWVALWGGFGVGRFDIVSGRMISFIEIPVPYVTFCSFVGTHLDTLIITTAKDGMNKQDLINYPLSGHTFVSKPGIKAYLVLFADYK